nr:PREDICTED: uncharacterized protein LOC109037552 [Bemisia tabaci]
MIRLHSPRTHLTPRLYLLVLLSWICHEGLAVVDGESGAAGAERRVVSRETNPIRFVRLVVQRLIYGIATMIGLQDAAEEVADGALVPPGVDDYGFGLDTDTGIAADNKDYEDDDDYKDDDEGYDDYIY